MSLSRSLRPCGELVVIVATALFFALAIQAYAVKPYVIPTPSMVPTLEVGQRVLVDRFSDRLGGDPKLDDITVFMPPRGADSDGDSAGSPARARPTTAARAAGAPARGRRRAPARGRTSSASSACPAIASRFATAA